MSDKQFRACVVEGHRLALMGMAMDQRAREGRDKITGEPWPERWTPRLNGPSWRSPRADVEAELARVEAARAAPGNEWLRQATIEVLRATLLIATEKGGSWRDHEGTKAG